MLSAEQVSYAYQDRTVLKNVTIEVPRGSQVALIGESGCGKSTLLKLLYGILQPDEGRISFDGQPIFGPKYQLVPGAPFMQYLAQDFGLMPFSTVAENIGTALSNTDKTKKRARVSDLLAMVEMSDYAQTKPQFLSGGQQQRVALAKALANDPQLLLLDEPFSQIDQFRANALRRNIFDYFKTQKITVLMATHDSADVLSFCDAAIAMSGGEIVAEGKSAALYQNPPSKYVASLFGDVNEISASLLVPETIGVRLLFPHQLRPTAHAPLMATVKQHYFMGTSYRMACVYSGGVLYFDHPSAYPKGALVYLTASEK